MQDALAEIRQISSGVSLPELSKMTTEEVIEAAIGHHERRTGAAVGRHFDGLPEVASQAAKTCIYRCVQESLNNSFRHAGGKGQIVSAQNCDNQIRLVITDSGPGFDMRRLGQQHAGLGLPGLRHRAELLGGTFELTTEPGKGTTVSVSIPREGSDDL